MTSEDRCGTPDSTNSESVCAFMPRLMNVEDLRNSLGPGFHRLLLSVLYLESCEYDQIKRLQEVTE
jgi:hypothetical protein